MSMAELEHHRHAEERGNLLRLLKENYTTGLTTVGSLAGAMDMLGQSMSLESLRFQLQYLEDQGYVQLKRNRDMPGWRSDRIAMGRADEVRFARLLPRGLMLIDGRVGEDPMVRF